MPSPVTLLLCGVLTMSAPLANASAQTLLQPLSEILPAGWEGATDRAKQAIATGALSTPAGATTGAQHASKAAEALNSAAAAFPAVLKAQAQSVGNYGVYAFLYDDKTVKEASRPFAEALAAGLRSLSLAIAEDMAQGGRQPTGRAP